MDENNSRMFRGPRTVISKTNYNACQKNSSDCMFLTPSGCSAEWCIFAELPKITTGGRELTCSICGKNKITVSMYSGTTSYICPECQEKIKKITPDKKLCSVCNTNEVEIDQCICSECQEKLVEAMKDSTCPICGANTGIKGSICTSCANKIKEKLNE